MTDEADAGDKWHEELMRHAPPDSLIRKYDEEMPVSDPLRAAYHEAGHAVAAVKLGLPVTHVFIEENQHGEWEGVTNVPLRQEERVDWEREHNTFLVFLYAAIATQKKLGTKLTSVGATIRGTLQRFSLRFRRIELQVGNGTTTRKKVPGHS